MTMQQISWLIDEAAECAAHASIDAHGELVDPHMAWDFIRQVCEDTEGETYGFMRTLPDGMPRQFLHDYRRHGRLIARDQCVGGVR